MQLRYRIDELGYYQFEALCQSLLLEKCGLLVECWGGSGDAGKDAYSEGPLKFPELETRVGPFIFQAKFVENANAPGAKPRTNLLRAVKSEARQIAKRLQEGKWEGAPAVYCLLTNVTLSEDLREEAKAGIKEVLPKCDVHTLGAREICGLLDAYPSIRSGFPQILSLADLEQLISNAIARSDRRRSSLAIEDARELAPVFVQTPSYNEAQRLLAKNSFVLLSGMPEMGKTAIARMIGLGKLGEKWECYECIRADAILEFYEPSQPQVFIADDAFGSTEYGTEKSEAWAVDLERILRIVDDDHWLIMTSRTAPLRAALERLSPRGRAKSFPEPSMMEVDASNLPLGDKARILYWHALSAGLEDICKLVIKSRFRTIIASPYFTPERVHRLVSERLAAIAEEMGIEKLEAALRYSPHDFRKNNSESCTADKMLESALKLELVEPTKSMRVSFDALRQDEKLFLISMLDTEFEVASIRDVCDSYLRQVGDEPALDPNKVASRLIGHFIADTRVNGSFSAGKFQQVPSYEWLHPTWRDLLIEYLSDDRVARRRFLRTCTRYGLALAISTQGGAAGERFMPLLRDDTDSELIVRGFAEVVGNGEAQECYSVLESLLGFANIDSSPRIERERREILVKTAVPILEAIRNRILELGRTWNYSRLHDWFDLNVKLGRRLCSPNLSGDIDRAVTLVDDFLDNDSLSKSQPYSLEDWVDLFVVLRKFDTELADELVGKSKVNELVELLFSDESVEYFTSIDSDSESILEEYSSDLNSLFKAMETCADFATENLNISPDEVMEVLSEVEDHAGFLGGKLEDRISERNYSDSDDEWRGGSHEVYDLGALFENL